MKKLLYLSAIGLGVAALASCESEPENPGDFSLKSTLEVVQVRSLVTGEVYPLTVARSIDSTYRYSYEVYDTVKDPATGEPVLGTDGKLQITSTTEYYNSKTTAKFVEFEPIVFPSYDDVAQDTIQIELASNASWISNADNMSPTNELVTWYSVLNSSSTGGGDGYMLIGVNKFLGGLSRHMKVREVLTRDSTVMYRFTFRHTGMAYTGQ
ncbi:MAG: hypothetical protein NC418_09600 [Muribaculaceae bacterium]|nr:hypothetical protein [Muribaculaceae bacterium]